MPLGSVLVSFSLVNNVETLMYTIKKNEAADVGILNDIYLRLVKDGKSACSV